MPDQVERSLLLHESMGKSPQEFLISYRMTKATELLKLTDLSISDIGVKSLSSIISEQPDCITPAICV